MAPKHLECDQCNLTFTNESDREAHLISHVKSEPTISEEFILADSIQNDADEMDTAHIKTEEVLENNDSPNTFLESIRGKIRGKLSSLLLPAVEVVINVEEPKGIQVNELPFEETEDVARNKDLDDKTDEDLDRPDDVDQDKSVDSFLTKKRPVPKLVTTKEMKVLQNQNASKKDSSDSPDEASFRERKHKCSRCKKKFLRKADLARHVTITCTYGPIPFHKCKECGKIYKRKDTLQQHNKIHHGEPKMRRKQAHKCPYCHLRFHGASLLEIHIRKHTGERPFECEFCDKAFPSAIRLNYHRRVHTGEKPYSCNICHKKFSMSNALKKHMLLHSDDSKPYKCMFCDKGFNQSCGLKSHIFYHTGENGFDCKLCGRVFSRKVILQKHHSNVHEKLRPFECTSCDRCFSNKADLERHKNTHIGNKPHHCQICKKGLSSKCALKTHMLVHNREKPSCCQICERPFKRLDCLARHMKSKHNLPTGRHMLKVLTSKEEPELE